MCNLLKNIMQNMLHWMILNEIKDSTYTELCIHELPQEQNMVAGTE